MTTDEAPASPETKTEKEPKPYAFGERIHTPKPGPSEGCPWRQRGSEKGFRVSFERPNGDFKNHNENKEEEKMDSDQVMAHIQGRDFEYRVTALRKEGLTLAQAISKISAEFPEVYQDYLRRAQVGEAHPLDMEVKK